MRNAITYTRCSNIREARRLKSQLKAYAKKVGYKVVQHIEMPPIGPRKQSDDKLMMVLNELLFRDIKVDAIITTRYEHLHTRFTDTLSLIKNLSHYNVRIISIEETLCEDDPIFKEVYYPVKEI
jgi:DNA invertase Pin-like site-specific DNA recombinase